MSLEALILLVSGGLFTLILGNYVFSWQIFQHFTGRLNTMMENHLKHIVDDIEMLKRKINGSDGGDSSAGL